jgi:putative ATP-dependent endonuclease of OLD family
VAVCGWLSQIRGQVGSLGATVYRSRESVLSLGIIRRTRGRSAVGVAPHVLEVGAFAQGTHEEFSDDSKLVTALGGALLEEDPMRARLTYRFAPIDSGGEATSKVPRYRGAVYGGDNFEKAIATELRSYLHLLFLHALRDVESDIRNWRRSPLRALLQGAATAAAEEDLEVVRLAMKDANDKLNDLDVVKDLGGSIGRRLVDMVGAKPSR